MAHPESIRRVVCETPAGAIAEGSLGKGGESQTKLQGRAAQLQRTSSRALASLVAPATAIVLVRRDWGRSAPLWRRMSLVRAVALSEAGRAIHTVRAADLCKGAPWRPRSQPAPEPWVLTPSTPPDNGESARLAKRPSLASAGRERHKARCIAQPSQTTALAAVPCFVPAVRAQAATRRSSPRRGRAYDRPGLSEEEIEEIREAFNLFDTDGSGERGSCLAASA